MAAVIRGVVAALALVAPVTAAAAPAVPKELEGLELDPGVTAVDVDRRVTKLDGRRVVVLRQRIKRVVELDGLADRRTVTELVVVDVSTRAIALQVPIAATYARDEYGLDRVAGSYEYRTRWIDRNGDGVDELALELVKESGAGAEGARSERLFQLRYGRFVEVDATAAGCPRGLDDDVAVGAHPDASRRATVLERFVATVDDGDPPDRVLCAFVDAAAASPQATEPVPLPAPGQSIALAPIAVDCPAASWAARRGRRITPARVGFFFSASDAIVVQIVGGDLTVTVAQPLTGRATDPISAYRWRESWVVDNRLLVFAEVETDGAHRWVVVFEPGRERPSLVRYLDLGEASALVKTTNNVTSRFEIVIAREGKREVVWRREATSWRP